MVDNCVSLCDKTQLKCTVLHSCSFLVNTTMLILVLKKEQIPREWNRISTNIWGYDWFRYSQNDVQMSLSVCFLKWSILNISFKRTYGNEW